MKRHYVSSTHVALPGIAPVPRPASHSPTRGTKSFGLGQACSIAFDGSVIIACPRPPVNPEMKNRREITANLRLFRTGFSCMCRIQVFLVQISCRDPACDDTGCHTCTEIVHMHNDSCSFRMECTSAWRPGFSDRNFRSCRRPGTAGVLTFCGSPCIISSAE